MSVFENEKKIALKKMVENDKSKKGSLDKEIIELLNAINSLQQYYTTSSCSGRIMLIEVPKERRKDKVKWLYVTHEKAEFEVLSKILFENKLNLKEGSSIWFKQEPLILHVCCRTLDDAQKLIDIARYSGFKKSGIIATRKRIIVEIEGTDLMSTIVHDKTGVLITKEYLKKLVQVANKKLIRNLNKKEKFLKELKKEFKIRT